MVDPSPEVITPGRFLTRPIGRVFPAAMHLTWWMEAPVFRDHEGDTVHVPDTALGFVSERRVGKGLLGRSTTGRWALKMPCNGSGCGDPERVLQVGLVSIVLGFRSERRPRETRREFPPEGWGKFSPEVFKYREGSASMKGKSGP